MLFDDSLTTCQNSHSSSI